jgi:hypothetical protein
MTILNHQEAGGDDWTGRYEQLRQHALGGTAPQLGCLWGLEALLQNGLAGWLRAVQRNDTIPETAAATSVTCGWLATQDRETTWVLAEMTLPQLFQMHGRS